MLPNIITDARRNKKCYISFDNESSERKNFIVR